ncbi:hypothetical protein H4R19_002858 [Coemansia spiralis]|nr:hypothetical protein H4R19_002858 [Coemansia spiralis]
MNSEGLTYENLVVAAEAAPGTSPSFELVVVPLLWQWKSPLGEFRADILGNALRRVDAQESSAVFLQLVADALSLARTGEQYAMALDGLHTAVAGVQFEQLVAAPMVVRRLAAALGQAAAAANDHGRICEAVLALLDRLTPMMRADCGSKNKSKSKGKGLRAWQGEVLCSGMDSGVRLTPLHVECLKQCLLSRRRDLYERAAAAVVVPRFDSLGTMVAQRARALMEYNLYAGMVCVGTGDVARAARLWTAVFALPSKHASAIHVAAYKRLTLAELELSGRRVRLPACFAPTHARTVESHAAGYVALGDAFAARTLAPAVAKLTDMRAVLDTDGNRGLAARVMQAAPAHFVRRVGRAYARVSVGRLVELTGFSAHPMAAGGDPCARLAQYISEMADPTVALVAADPAAPPRDMVVHFTDPAATAAAALAPAERTRREELWATRMADKVRETDELRARLDGIDRHLALTREHVLSLRNQPTAA